MEWFVSRAGQNYGPYPFEALVAAAKDGTLLKEDQLWRQGMLTWEAAMAIPGLWLPPPSSMSEAPEFQEVEPLPEVDSPAHLPSSKKADIHDSFDDIKSSESNKHGFLKQYWHGEISLPVSYWLVGITIYVVVGIVSYIFGEIVPKLALTPAQTAWALIAFITFLVACTVWQAVGLWRSASNYKKSSKTPGWGTAAQILLLIGVAQSAVAMVKTFWPLMVASASILVGNNEIPPYQMRLMNGANELELSGGIPYGTATALKSFLDAAPTVKIVHLNSTGGLIEEGLKVGGVIRGRGLTTYTATSCMSACTLAFLGGRPRFLSNDARLGFHSASYGGIDAKDIPELNSSMRDALIAMAVPKWFIDKTLATSANDMWFPTQQELLGAGVVTKIVDRADYALSGVPDWQKPDLADSTLLQIPFYAVLKDKDPESYVLLKDRFADGIRKGSTSIAIQGDVHSAFQSQVLPKVIQAAPDSAVVNYWKIQVEEIRRLRDTDPSGCVQFLFPDAQPVPIDLNKLLGEQLLARDVAALTEMIQKIESHSTQNTSESELTNIMVQLLSAEPKVAAIIQKPSDYYSQPAALCGAFLSLFDNVMSLPPDRAAAGIRSIFSKS